MANGVIIRAVPKTLVVLSSGAIQSIILAKGLDVAAYKEGEIAFRIHPGGTGVTAGTVYVWVYREAQTTEDPGVDFVEAVYMVQIPIAAGSAGPLLLPAALNPTGSNPTLGGQIRIVIGSATGGGTCNMYVSADLILKS